MAPVEYVNFAQPFPGRVADMAAFPARHRGIYTAPDSVTSLCIGRTAVWLQEPRSTTFGPQLPGSRPLPADTSYRAEDGRLHYLRRFAKDSVRETWLWTDTIFTLGGPGAGRLRRFQGHYYLSTSNESAENWQVQRLAIANGHLTWQTLGQDTLRLRALEPATLVRRQSEGMTYYRLTPGLGPQTRRLGRYAGLWETEGEFERRR
ncbi:hypothetical protein ACFQT0_08980 [Hymenobacter humi]|uniref:Uncharacterized protein n=1 Tax=Hymenobacter humi TaxID=1411620 RepID=A0ABW2U3P3_9BACT